jgi:hypothetical protein
MCTYMIRSKWEAGGGRFLNSQTLDISHFLIVSTEIKFLKLALPSSIGALTLTLTLTLTHTHTHTQTHSQIAQ